MKQKLLRSLWKSEARLLARKPLSNLPSPRRRTGRCSDLKMCCSCPISALTTKELRACMTSRIEKRFFKKCSLLSKMWTSIDLRRFVPVRSRSPNVFLELNLKAKTDCSIKCLTTWEMVWTHRRWRTLARRSRWRTRSRSSKTGFWGTQRSEESTLCFSRKRLEIWMSWNGVPNRFMLGPNQWAWTQTPYKILRSRWLSRNKIRGAKLRMIKSSMMI